MTTMPAADVEVWSIDLVDCREALLAEEQARPRLPIGHGMAEGGTRHLTHVALRIALERYIGPDLCGVPFEVRPGGRPELPAGEGGVRPTSFSLSHTDMRNGSVALIAVAGRGPLGIDIEFRRELRMSQSLCVAICRAANALAPLGHTLDDVNGTLQAWTRLEAVAKADGGGMARLLSHLGARGHGELEDDELMARAGALRDRLDLVVRDLDQVFMGRGSFAAIAHPRGMSVGVARFPDTLAGIAALAR